MRKVSNGSEGVVNYYVCTPKSNPIEDIGVYVNIPAMWMECFVIRYSRIPRLLFSNVQNVSETKEDMRLF